VIPANYWFSALHYGNHYHFNIRILSVQGTKRFGGSSYGIWGTNIGLVAGLLSPIRISYRCWALMGELLYDSKITNALGKLPQGLLLDF
jgi:uncharacterized protein YqgC (DUF456 family)